jgi:hypothetical protein
MIKKALRRKIRPYGYINIHNYKLLSRRYKLINFYVYLLSIRCCDGTDIGLTCFFCVEHF